MYPVLSTTEIFLEVSLLTELRKLIRNVIPDNKIGNNKVIRIKDLLPILFKYSLVAISEKCSILIVFNRVNKYFVCTRNNFLKMNDFRVLTYKF